MGKIKVPKEAKNAFWGGAVVVALKVMNDIYKGVKEKLKVAKEKKDKEDELKKLQELRPWDYYEAPKKAVYGGGLPVNVVKPLWGYGIYEGYCFILFAPTNVGKTALALQIVNELAYNETSDFMPDWEIGKNRQLMYFDEEYGLNNFPPELQKFYENKDNRVVFYGKSGGVEQFLDRLYQNVKKSGKPTVAFVDNIGAVCGGNTIKQEKRLLEGVWKIINYLRDKGEPSIPLTIVLIGHTNVTKYPDRFKHCSEGNLQGASEQANYATGMIELAYTHRAGYYRLDFPKNKRVPKTDKVYMLHRRDALNFEYVCQMDENEALSKNVTFECSQSNEVPLVDPELLKRARDLAKDTPEAKEQLKQLKLKVEDEFQFANMDAEGKNAILERAQQLRKAGHTPRVTSCIILLEKNIYISHNTINEKTSSST